MKKLFFMLFILALLSCKHADSSLSFEFVIEPLVKIQKYDMTVVFFDDNDNEIGQVVKKINKKKTVKIKAIDGASYYRYYMSYVQSDSSDLEFSGSLQKNDIDIENIIIYISDPIKILTPKVMYIDNIQSDCEIVWEKEDNAEFYLVLIEYFDNDDKKIGVTRILLPNTESKFNLKQIKPLLQQQDYDFDFATANNLSYIESQINGNGITKMNIDIEAIRITAENKVRFITKAIRDNLITIEIDENE